MPQKEAVELYDSALHYCTGKLNKGVRLFLQEYFDSVSYTHLRAHETVLDLVCRLLLEKKKE